MSHTRSGFELQQLFLVCNRDPVLKAKFLNCTDYHELLGVLFAAKKLLNPKFSFAMFARRAGFAARGFAKDVISGKKRLTSNSLRRVIKGLDLAQDLAEFFSYQVASQEHDVVIRELSKTQVKQLLSKQRHRLHVTLSSSSSLSETIPHLSLFRNLSAPKVYAALGDLKTGASLKEIKGRTGFTLLDIKKALQHLIMIGMVEESSPLHYKARIHDIYIQEEEAASAFKQYYVDLISKKSAAAASANFDDPNKLYWFSHASVKSQDLPKFKQDLRDLLKHYIEKMEDSAGDKIVDLCVSFT